MRDMRETAFLNLLQPSKSEWGQSMLYCRPQYPLNHTHNCDLNHKMALSARLCFQKIVRSAQSPDGGTANTGLYKAGRIGPTRGIALWGPMFSVRLCSSRYP